LLDGRKSFEVKVREVVVPRGSLQLGAWGRRLGRSLDGYIVVVVLDGKMGDDSDKSRR
jgi:hypothetical protein